MDRLSPSTRDFARRLLAVSRTASAPGASAVGTPRVIELLRVSLTRLSGADGVAALLRRALVLASAEFPSLANVKLSDNGRLEGFEEIAAGSGGAAGEIELTITAYLLELLMILIGKSLTLKLVHEIWPDASFDESH